MMTVSWGLRARVVVAVAMIGGCAAEPEETYRENAQPETIVVPAGIDSAARIGQGRDLVKEQLRAECVRSGTTLHIPTQYSNMQFDSSMARDEARQMMGYKADTKAKFKLLDASAKARFSRELVSLSVGMYYAADYSLGLDKLDEGTLQWLVQPGAPDWLTRCGDEFMLQKETGGQLFVTYRIDFSSTSDKQEFEGSVGLSIPAANVNAEVQRVASRFVGRARVHVEAFQVGGDVTQLATMLGGGGADANLGRVVLDCSLTNLAPCGTFIQNAINYAAGPFATSLRTMPADRTYLYEDWAMLGVPLALRVVPVEVKLARVDLLNRLDEQLEFAARVTSLKSGLLYVSDAIRGRLDAYDYAVQRNLTVLSSASRSCWDDLGDPGNAAQVAACLAAVRLDTLVANGFDASLTMALLDVMPRVTYQVRTSASGWGAIAKEGQIAGVEYVSTGGITGTLLFDALAARGLSVPRGAGLPAGASVCYRIGVPSSGIWAILKIPSWTGEVCDGAVADVGGASPRMLQVRLVNAPAGTRVCYQTWSSELRWMPEVCDGASQGDYSKAFQAVRVRVVP